MNIVNTLKLIDPGFPEVLRTIPSPPKQIFYIGAHPSSWLASPRVAVVGSRRISVYGEAATKRVVSELASLGVVIISGLAYGVDAAAHAATLRAGGKTVAVLAGSLERIHPVAHLNLAKQIIDSGGTILSEYPAPTPYFKTNFIARNRIVSGLADALLITEAAINSGTMHTAKFALDQGKTVMAIPGNITSPGSEGTNNLIKSGATMVTETSDVLLALNLKRRQPTVRQFNGTATEASLLELIRGGTSNQEELAIASGLDSTTFSSSLTMLEISGFIRPLGAGIWDAL